MERVNHGSRPGREDARLTIDRLYEFLNMAFLSPWMIALLAVIMFFLAVLLGGVWRMLALVFVAMAALVVVVVYVMFGMNLITGFLEVRIAGRIAVFALLLAVNILLVSALLQTSGSAGDNDR